MAVTELPEAVSYRALLRAVAMTRAEIQYHEEELAGIKARTDKTAEVATSAADKLANAVDPDGGRIDAQTLAEIRDIAAAAQGAAAACAAYVTAAKDTVASADACDRDARRRNQGYQEAVDAAPVKAPNRGFLTVR